MAVTSANEITRGRSGVEDGSGRVGVTQYTRVFHVESNSASDDATTILASTVTLGTQHPNDSSAYLQRREARQSPEHRGVWIVILTYSNERERTTDPLSDPAQITWGYAHFGRLATKDTSSNGIVNSAGDAFDPGPEIDASRPYFRIVKNVDVVPSWFCTYADAINTAQFVVDGQVIAAETAKIFDLSLSAAQVRDNVTFRSLEIEVHINSDTWALEVLDQGYRQIVGTSTDREPITNEDKSPITRPVPLDGSGAKLSNPGPTNVNYESFDVYAKKDFSVLPLV